MNSSGNRTWGSCHKVFLLGRTGSGIHKTNHYNVLYPSIGGTYEIRREKFTETVQPGDIYSKASFFKGISEVGIIPGVFAKEGSTLNIARKTR
ncbi:MAG: hypothetical protein R2744_13710 [Bacteroidales bacterium]